MATIKKITLLNDVTATGSAVELPLSGRWAFRCSSSDFNGATVDLQTLMPDGSIFTAVGSDTTITASAVAVVELNSGSQLKMVISVAVPGSGVFCTLTFIGP